MKSLVQCFVFAGVSEALIYRVAAREYSPLIFGLLSVTWGLGSLSLAWFEPRRGFVYLGSVVLSAPSLSYSMLGYGIVEMGGFVAFCAGVYVLPVHYLLQRVRARWQRSLTCAANS